MMGCQWREKEESVVEVSDYIRFKEEARAFDE